MTGPDTPAARRVASLAAVLVTLALVAAPACLPTLGTGPLPLPMEDQAFTLRSGLRYAAHPDRQAFQVTAETSIALGRWFTMDLGALYAAQRDPGLYPWQADDPADYKHSGMPFLRPTVHLGPVTLALTLSGAFAAGPQAGGMYGYGALTAGWATPSWAVYAGVAGHGFKYLTEHREPTGSSWQIAIGGQHRWVVAGGLLVGLDAEAGYLDQTFTEHGPSDERTRRAFTATIGLELGWALDPEKPPPVGPNEPPLPAPGTPPSPRTTSQ